MPELPEVEHLRRSLDPWIVGVRIASVEVRRGDVVARAGDSIRRPKRRPPADTLDHELLSGAEIVATHRHGKQMAIEASDGRAIVVQLGMTGSVALETDDLPAGADARHRHVVWRLEAASGSASTPTRARRGSTAPTSTPLAPDALPARMSFRDPRRFGGLTTHPSIGSVRATWAALGPDALTVTAQALAARLAATRRPVKSALLDQTIVAGVGNIYADESLHAAGIHPLEVASDLGSDRITALAREIRRILARAIRAGGSTLRDYRDAFGQPGEAVQTHRVYGRGDQPCLGCRTTLVQLRLQGRTTVFCPRCQDLSTSSVRSRGARRAR
jgi:formamidopyrimidine-DNA glycosylase